VAVRGAEGKKEGGNDKHFIAFFTILCYTEKRKKIYPKETKPLWN